MSKDYHSLIDEFKARVQKDLIFETNSDNPDLIDLPYPYVTPGKNKNNAIYYWDTFFINFALLKMKLVELARHNVDNLLALLRKFGYVPASNLRSETGYSALPMLPWMVRDIYRATGDKEWLRRHLNDVVKEFNYWTTKPHTTPTGLFRFVAGENGNGSAQDNTFAESGWANSVRFDDPRNYNPVDLNAILYRNAKIIFDLQVEAEGSGDQRLLAKSDQIKKISEMFWDEASRFYYDNNFVEKKLSAAKSLAGYMPLFVEMAPEERAHDLQKGLRDFAAPGGLFPTVNGKGSSAWERPHLPSPYLYFVIKGLCEYDFMEDAADIGTNWLDMVVEQYQKTGELWEWYNVEERSINSPNGVPNSPIMGWTMGTYVALLDSLGV